GEVRIFKHTVIAEEWVEPQSGIEDIAAPNGTRRRHKINLTRASEKWLEVGVDRITGLKVISPRFICRQQIQSAIPPSAFGIFKTEVSIRPVTGYAANSAVRVAGIDAGNSFKKIRFKSYVVIYQRNQVSAGRVDSLVPLNRGTSGRPNIRQV